jgi:hypothetical protein
MKALRQGLILSIASLLVVSSSAFAATNMRGGNNFPVLGKNVLTPTSVNPYVARILYAPSQDDDPAYRAAIGAAAGAIVDYFDARAATPTAELLNTYGCVYTWTNAACSDPVLFGDRLADYVDQGGHVVLGEFCTYTTGNPLGGRIMTAAYSPVTSPNGTNHFVVDAYAGDGTTCIHRGVTAYASYSRDVLVLQGAGVADGHYKDGEIAHAYRPDRKVIYSNGCGDATNAAFGASGDWPILIANGCACAEEVPTLPNTWGAVKAIYH